MQTMDVVFTKGREEVMRVRTPMTPANMDELSAELGHSMRLETMPVPEIISRLGELLSTNASPEPDWLAQAAWNIRRDACRAERRGATAVVFESREA